MQRTLITTTLGLLLALAPRAQAQQRTFATPEEAGKAVIGACAANREGDLISIFGPTSKEIIHTVDPEMDRERREKIVTAAAKLSTFQKDSQGKVTWVLGEDVWPFPIPLVSSHGRWRFDTQAGRAEVERRRIGHNELGVIDLLRAVVEAQQAYYDRDVDQDGVREFARRLLSTDGKHDGLYWETQGDEPASPMDSFAQTVKDYMRGKTSKSTWMGYRIKLLTAQGPNAPGGAYKYEVNGHMLLGYAVLAYPADYANTGIMSFEVNRNGRVMEKDLGPNTVQMAEKITTYNPDKTWRLVAPSGVDK